MTLKTKAGLEKLIEYINDSTEVNCTLYESSDSEHYVEMEYYSNLGEDVLICFYFDSPTVDDFLKELNNINEQYKERCEEDLELYVAERPSGSENFSVRELLNDADWKAKFFNNFVKDLNKVVKNKDFKSLVSEAAEKMEAQKNVGSNRTSKAKDER